MEKVISDIYQYKISEILTRVQNPVNVEMNTSYVQIGIRSHGKGIFIKDSVTGRELGNKRVFWIEDNCFIVNIVFAWERAVARTTKDLVGFIASHRFPMYRVDESKVDLDYFARLFQTKQGQYLLELASPGGAGRNKTLGQKEFNELVIELPSIKVQKYITGLLNLLDLRIRKQQEKVDAWREYKKGMVQKLFSRELRFKDEDGGEFSEWESQPLSELGTFGKSYSYSRALEGEGEYKHIHYGDIHSKYPTVCSCENYPTITVKKSHELIVNGDVIFADASEDYSDLGKAILICDTDNENLIAGLHTHKFSPSTKIDSTFLIYYTKTRAYRKFIRRMGTGVSVLGISKSNLRELELPLPSVEEQIKIGRILLLLEKKVETLENEIKLLENQKKAFMQQMFI